MPDQSIVPQTAASDHGRTASISDVLHVIDELTVATTKARSVGLRVPAAIHGLTPDVLRNIASRGQVYVREFEADERRGAFLNCCVYSVNLYAYLDEEA